MLRFVSLYNFEQIIMMKFQQASVFTDQTKKRDVKMMLFFQGSRKWVDRYCLI